MASTFKITYESLQNKKNDATVKWACINEGKKNSEPCGVQFHDLWISGPENNHCAKQGN